MKWLFFFHRLSIKGKLIGVILISTGVVLFLGTTVVIYKDINVYHERLIRESKMAVQILSQDFVKIMLLDSSNIAADIFAKLKAFPHFKNIYLFDADEQLIIRYAQTPADEIPTPEVKLESITFEEGFGHFYLPLEYLGKSFGTIYLRFSTQALHAQLDQYYVIVTLFVLFLMLIAIILAFGFDRYFSTPIQKLMDQLEERESSTRAIVDSAAEGIITLNGKQEIDTINQAVSDIFGYSVEELLGQTLGFVIPEITQDLSTFTQEDRFFEQQGRRKDQSPFPMMMSISQVTLPNKMFFTVTFRDITDQKNDELALSNAKEVAESANKAKDQFLANISHEIRTPMNAILGYAQILAETELDKEQHKDVQTIIKAGDHLLHLINDVLDLAKIDAGAQELNIRDFNLYPLIEDITALFSIRCQSKSVDFNINIDIPKDTQVQGDAGKVKQILINILGNAVKFTHQGEVMLRVSSSQENVYDFTIQDTGPGISQAAQENIFNPFQQAEAGVQSGGTGLGLCIVNKHLEMMNTTLRLQSEPEQGSRFSFTLYLPPAESTHLSDAHLIHYHLKSEQSILALIVDDVPDNRDIMMMLLHKAGIRSEAVENGEQALQHITEQRPDIVFMDISMPVMGGIEALQHIRATYGTDLICVAVSASNLMQQPIEYHALGFDDFITKPFKTTVLFDTIAKVLNVEFEWEQVSAVNTWDVTDMQLPHRILEQLKDAAELGQITEINKLIQHLRHANAEDFADHISGLVAHYDFQGVLKVLDAVN